VGRIIHDTRPITVFAISALACLAFTGGSISAAELFVGGEGDAYASISAALSVAREGDIVILHPGTYAEPIRSVAARVTLRGGSGSDPVVITAGSTVLTVEHPGFGVENLILDGQYGAADTVLVLDEARGFHMKGVEVRRSGYDCIDLGSPRDVVIEDSLVHHCLRTVARTCVEEPCPEPPDCAAADCRMDAHGIAAGAVRNLKIINTEIHTFSGDGIQVDADRLHPGWDRVVVEGCHIWLQPLSGAVAGFAAGIVPGENAIDTKTPLGIDAPANLTVHDTLAHGFRGGLVRMSAFNLKENVRVDVQGVTVHDSQIAFRIRGRTAKSPYAANVRIADSLIYDVGTAIRYEAAIEKIRLRRTTIGPGVVRVFDNQASHSRGVIDGRDILTIATELPEQLDGGNNRALFFLY